MLIILLIFMIFLGYVLYSKSTNNLKKNSKLIFTVLAITFLSSSLISCNDVNQKVKSNNENTIEAQQPSGDNTIKVQESSSKDATKEQNYSPKSKITESLIHFIDTGNSDAILIKGEKNILIDGADNDDETSLVEYLKKQSIGKIDYIIATHPDADHVGALDSIIKNFNIETLLVANGSKDTKTYRDFINEAANKGLSPSVPIEGKKFVLGENSYITLFNGNGGSDANEQSLVTLYVNGEDKILFMGDAGEETEQELMNRLPDVDLIKIGHHGSRTSTSSSFLNKVNPEIAVITVGKDNSYGHPHKETVEKLEDKKIKLYRTDQCGTITFTSTGKGLKTVTREGNYTPGNKSKDKIDNTNSNKIPNIPSDTTENTDNINSNSNEIPNNKTVFLSKQEQNIIPLIIAEG